LTFRLYSGRAGETQDPGRWPRLGNGRQCKPRNAGRNVSGTTSKTGPKNPKRASNLAEFSPLTLVSAGRPIAVVGTGLAQTGCHPAE